jgi:hypothetical protein
MPGSRIRYIGANRALLTIGGALPLFSQLQGQKSADPGAEKRVSSSFCDIVEMRKIYW